MKSSIGIHTMAITLPLNDEDGEALLQIFKACKFVSVVEDCNYNPYDQHAKYFRVNYKNENVGIIWILKITNHVDYYSLFSCSIKAIINPKILSGENTYIVAANKTHLYTVEEGFNREAAKLSPILRKFYDYSLNRLDYCINFDIYEIYKECPKELKKKLPLIMMYLIKQGDIPDHFRELDFNDKQFYLKSNSVVINAYWTYYDLKQNYSSCVSLKESHNIIRFEVQYKYQKMNHITNKVKKELTKNKNMDLYEHRVSSKFKLNNIMILEELLSDEMCMDTIGDYYNSIIKKGDYYSLKKANQLIEEKCSSWDKITRLKNTLKLISEYGGIAKAKDNIDKESIEDFRKSLRELTSLNINPVVIPEEWGIEFIPNLLYAYYDLLSKERMDKWLKCF